MDKQFVLTVDWCQQGRRGVFCNKDGVAHVEDHELSCDETFAILGPFYLILDPKWVEMSDEAAKEYSLFVPLAEYSYEWGVAIRPEDKDVVELKKGTQVIYVPNHLQGKKDPRDPMNWTLGRGIQPGFIMGKKNDHEYWCRFWYADKNGLSFYAGYPELRTRSTSELVDESLLVLHNYTHKRWIKWAIDMIEGGSND